MAAQLDFHGARALNRTARILIGSLLVLVLILSVSAGAAWSRDDGIQKTAMAVATAPAS